MRYVAGTTPIRWLPTGLLLAALLALAVFSRGFTAFPSTYYMTGPSMEPSVGQGGWFLARPLRGMPARGQLVLMEVWIDDTLYHVLRRAVGLPGDTLRMVDGLLRVNGRAADWPARIIERRAERTLDGPIPGTIYNWGPVAVGPDSVFLLSDTRDMVGWPDSRFLGAVPRERVVERYLFRIG
ncbi:MAG TPA: signal peptidase I [Gemmatimonadales bacterium]|nr:signal peptidase I [Gemmatimonadales bacterium]